MATSAKLGNSSYKFGNTSRLFGLPSGLHNYYVAGNQLFVQPVGGNPSVLVSTASYSDFVFRVQMKLTQANNVAGVAFHANGASPTNYYTALFEAATSTISLYKVQSGAFTLLDQSNVYCVPTNSFFTIEVHSNNSFFTILLNQKVVLTSYDATFTSGNVGFCSKNNAVFQNVTMPTLYETIAAFTVNPGDSFLDAIQNALQSKGAYIRVNYDNNIVISVPSSSDSSVYTYQNEIFENAYSQSDQENINCVVVYGANNNISGTAYDQTSIDAHGKQIRTAFYTDETLTTNAQCQTEALRQLAVIQRYEKQPNIVTPVNVGIELFDVVTVNDSVANLDTSYRVMNIQTQFDATQDFTYDQTLGLATI